MRERDIVDRLRAPAYWISGSSEGHEGDNDAPTDAAAEILCLRAQVAALERALWNIAHESMFSSKDTLCKYAAEFAPKERPDGH